MSMSPSPPGDMRLGGPKHKQDCTSDDDRVNEHNDKVKEGMSPPMTNPMQVMKAEMCGHFVGTCSVCIVRVCVCAKESRSWTYLFQILVRT